MALPFNAPTLTPMTETGGSMPASSRPWSTPTCAAPRAPPPPRTQVRRVGPKITSSGLCSLFPRGEVPLLLLGQRVYGDAHRAKLEPRNLGVDLVRHIVDALLERAGVLGDVLGAERLVREAHVHHGRGMAFGRGQID